MDYSKIYDGFDTASLEEVAALNKALQANDGVTDVSMLQGGPALQYQSLEATKVMLTSQEESLTLYRDIPKGEASSTLEEFTVQTGYGQDGFGFVDQMENPEEADPDYARETARVKFQRQIYRFSDVSRMVKSISSAEKESKQAAIMRCLRNTEKGLISGDNSIIPQSFDGFAKIIESNGSRDHVVDMRGRALTQETFRLAGQLVTDNYGNVSHSKLYCSTGGRSALDATLSPGQRFNQTSLGADGGIMAGYMVNTVATAFGVITARTDLFIGGEYEGKGVPLRPDPSNPRQLIEGATSDKAPRTPSLAVSVVPSVSGSKWNSVGLRPSGKIYSYRIAAINKYGYSAACNSVTMVNPVETGGATQLNISMEKGDPNPPLGYEIYSEMEAGSGEFRLVKRIKSGGDNTVFIDKNDDIPGTTRMFLLDFTELGEMRTVQFKQLAPMFAEEYAKIGPYRWGAVNLYGMLLPYAPLRFVEFKNIPTMVSSASKNLNI